MFMPWSELAAFLDSGFRELIETDFAQIRYGDVGMATWLAIGLGMDPARLLLALGAVPAGQAPALGHHAAIDALLGARRELGSIDAHVSNGDALVGQRLLSLSRDLPHDLHARILEHLGQRVAPDHLPHVVADGPIDPLPGVVDSAGKRTPVRDRIVDPPDHVVVDHELLAVLGLDRQGLGGQVKPAAIVDPDAIQKGNAHDETRRRHSSHLSQPKNHLLLILSRDDDRSPPPVARCDEANEGSEDQRGQDEEAPHRSTRSVRRPSGRYGNTCAVPDSMITFSTLGRIASIVSR